MKVLGSLLRYYVQGTERVDATTARTLLKQIPSGEPIMQTFIDRYIEQGREQGRRLGSAGLLPGLIEQRLGQPDETVREHIMSAEPDTLLDWSTGRSPSSTPIPSTRCRTEMAGTVLLS